MRRIAFIVLITLSGACGASAETNPCVGREPHVRVGTTQHVLWLCEAGAPSASYEVRLGKGGVGKTREGDGKVPLGKYGLGAARASSKYGTFIPILYPTAEQRARGYTGRDVGIHGPHRSLKWLGRLVNALDTTDGCVGLATDEETTAIAAWLARSGAKSVYIE